MKDFSGIAEAVCPKCGKAYRAPSALSCVDNCTPICPECGIREALDSIGVQPEEAEKIITTIREHTGRMEGEE